MSTLVEFFGIDRKSRWRVIALSALITAGWGIAAETSGKSIRNAQLEATLVGALAFAAQVSFYCFKRSVVGFSNLGQNIDYRFPRRIAVSAAILLLIGSVPAPLLEAEMLRRRFRALVRDESPPDPRAISDIILRAREVKARLEPNLISNAGFRLLQDAEHGNTLEGQRALSAILDYKSFLDSGAAPDTVGAKPDLMNSWIEINLHNPEGIDVGTRQAPHVEQLGVAPESEGSVMQSLDNTFGRPPKRPLSPRVYVVTSKSGWGIQLDDMRYKNVIFKNSEIFYRGGPVELINVYFVNCRFMRYDSPRWSEFAKAILASSAVTFEASPRG